MRDRQEGKDLMQDSHVCCRAYFIARISYNRPCPPILICELKDRRMIQ